MLWFGSEMLWGGPKTSRPRCICVVIVYYTLLVLLLLIASAIYFSNNRYLYTCKKHGEFSNTDDYTIGICSCTSNVNVPELTYMIDYSIVGGRIIDTASNITVRTSNLVCEERVFNPRLEWYEYNGLEFAGYMPSISSYGHPIVLKYDCNYYGVCALTNDYVSVVSYSDRKIISRSGWHETSLVLREPLPLQCCGFSKIKGLGHSLIITAIVGGIITITSVILHPIMYIISRKYGSPNKVKKHRGIRVKPFVQRRDGKPLFLPQVPL